MVLLIIIRQVVQTFATQLMSQAGIIPPGLSK